MVRRVALIAVSVAGALATLAYAQLIYPPSTPVDTSSLATKAEVEAMQASMPLPSNAIVTGDAVGGSMGSSPRYRRMDDAAPRITRSTIVNTASGGTFSVTWSNALPAAPAVMLTPLASSASIDCQLTAAPTTTSVQGRCFTAQTTSLNLTIVTAGLTLNPVANSSAGIPVHVLAIPVTQ